MPIVYYTYIHTYIYIAFCRRCHTHGAEDNIWRRRSDTVFSSMGVAGIAKERCFTFIIHQEIDAYVYTIW